MIRNVVTGRIAADAGPGEHATLDRGLAGVAGLDLPGMLANRVGRDAGIREGAWSFAIVNDWVDADAYRAYDVDPEHLRHRATIASVCSDLSRVQVDLPD